MLKKASNFISLLFIVFIASNSQAKTLFEGWFEVLVGQKKVGYLVERYEFVDDKFKAVTYLKTGTYGGNVTESLKAFSKPDLTPINYAYTSKTGNDIKVIDATFKGEVLTLKIFDGKKEKKETKKIRKGTFLSTFLLYLMMNQENGLDVGKNYSYYALAEEDGTVQTGKAIVTANDKVKDKQAVKVLNEFKGERYFSWVTKKGEFLLVRNPGKNLEVRFAPNQEVATNGFDFNKKDLKLLFGKIPGDDAEIIDEGDKKPSKAKEPPKEKGEDVKPGQGIQIKGAPPPKAGKE